MRRPWRLPCPWPVQVPMVSITVPGKGCFQLSLLLGWRYMKWYDMIWHDMKWYEMIWHDMKWYEMIWNDMIWNDTSYTLQEIGDFWHFFNFGSSSRRRCSTAKAFGSHGGRCWDSALPEFGRLLSKQSAFFSVQNPGCSCFILVFFTDDYQLQRPGTVTGQHDMITSIKTITSVSVYCNWLELDIIAGAQVHGMAIASCPKGLGIWKPPRHCSRSPSSCRARPASWPTSRCCGRLGMWCASSERRTVASASRPFFVSSTRQTAKPPNPPNRHLVWCSVSLRCSSVASAAGLRARSCWPLVRNI